MTTDAAEMLAAIREAFPERPLPNVTLRQAQLADQSLSREITDEEWSAEGEKDRSTAWTEIDDTTLEDCDAAMAHIDEEGFVYYLPAFISLAVRQLQSGNYNNSKCFSGTVFHLTFISENYALARLKRLTDRQIELIIEFLRLVRDRSKFDAADAERALKSYWETPEAHRRTLIYVP